MLDVVLLTPKERAVGNVKYSNTATMYLSIHSARTMKMFLMIIKPIAQLKMTPTTE